MKLQPDKLAAWAIAAAIVAVGIAIVVLSLNLALETVRGWL